jgi:hypothetical protein
MIPEKELKKVDWVQLTKVPRKEIPTQCLQKRISWIAITSELGYKLWYYAEENNS